MSGWKSLVRNWPGGGFWVEQHFSAARNASSPRAASAAEVTTSGRNEFSRSLSRRRRTTNLQSRFLIFRDNQASQLLELAVALPLLIVFVVAIFDFGQAFNLKQKLNTAVREGARHGSSLPTNDLTASGVPATVNSVRDVVDNYLAAAKVNDCGLNGQAGAAGTTPLSWTFTASSGCSGSLTLTVERGYSFPAVIATKTFNVISTRVTIRYPYQWQFNRVITLLVPGATYAGQTLITTDATVANVD